MNVRALAFIVLLASAAPAAAQQPTTPTPGNPVNSEDWYRAQLVELSEVLGGAHYLRILCDGRDDQRWRNYMRGVIDREPRYNAVLVEGFNQGYRTEETRFSRCDASAEQTEAELRARGLRIAQGLSARHAD
jgi:uncharacterized protein (TIGR02301 family)